MDNPAEDELEDFIQAASWALHVETFPVPQAASNQLMFFVSSTFKLLCTYRHIHGGYICMCLYICDVYEYASLEIAKGEASKKTWLFDQLQFLDWVSAMANPAEDELEDFVQAASWALHVETLQVPQAASNQLMFFVSSTFKLLESNRSSAVAVWSSAFLWPSPHVELPCCKRYTANQNHCG